MVSSSTQPLIGSISADRVEAAIDRLVNLQRPRYRRLWAYYHNPMRVTGIPGVTQTPGCERPYRQAQEWGLPPRITGFVPGAEPFADAGATGRARKEIVIENDIAWRIDTLCEYLFGRPVIIASQAPDPRRRELLGRLIDAILAHNGGTQFLQQMALIGAVYGFVDVLVKLEVDAAAELIALPQSSPAPHPAPETPDTAGSAPVPEPARGPAPDGDDVRASDPGADPASEARLARLARLIRLEIVEPARALPIVCDQDWRMLQAYGQVWEKDPASSASSTVASAAAARASWWNRLRAAFGPAAWRASRSAAPGQARMVELITPAQWLRLEDGRITARGVNSLGEIPLVHVQNLAQFQSYSGASDVEPLIPLQDELNTRLSDRAHRITLQSFKMYLGRGLEQFNDQPVAPGRMWMTDNENAEILEFGGDSACPSEEAHIADLREALDKTSGVTPIAAGAIKNRIGRLTSAAALRITLLALLSKTDRKRALYGDAIGRMVGLALKWLDVSGAFPSSADERRIELAWPSPLPENTIEKLQEAQAKLNLGVEKEVVLRELGY